MAALHYRSCRVCIRFAAPEFRKAPDLPTGRSHVFSEARCLSHTFGVAHVQANGLIRLDTYLVA